MAAVTAPSMRSLEVDPALVDAARRGDAAACERLLDRVLPVVVQWCARLGGPRVDPEDAAHDVGIVLLRRMADVHDTERFGAWLFSVTRRVLAQHRRKAWFRYWVPGITLDNAPALSDPGRDAERSDVSRRVQATLEELTPVHREVLVLFDLEERTEAEVADILDLPIGTVRSRVRSARESFRRAAWRHDLHPEVSELPSSGRRDA